MSEYIIFFSVKDIEFYNDNGMINIVSCHIHVRNCGINHYQGNLNVLLLCFIAENQDRIFFVHVLDEMFLLC